jgi:DNA invertase Pin-like site-specific DNA recombinase
LRQVAERAGWQVVDEYVDHGISGAKGRDKRPAFDRLMKDATRRRFDVVMAWSVDRLPASVERSIRAARRAGKGQLAIARNLRVGVSMVRRVLGAGRGTQAPSRPSRI